jgi:glycosyltransferase involved in cell wall biosynthesis
MPPKVLPKVVVNALHTTGGGGLVYLNNLLPLVAADARFELEILVSRASQPLVVAPPGVRVRVAPGWVRGRLATHVFAHVFVPVLARAWGARAVWCNANFVPLLAPKPIPTLHTTTRAGAAWPGFMWRVYWGLLRILTWLSIARAPVVFAVARHVLHEYPGSGAARKTYVAYPAVAAALPATQQPEKSTSTVVAVGDFYAQKNYPLLIQAFAHLRAELPTAQLRIIGRPVWPQVLAQVQAEIDKLGLANAVRITPGLPHAQLLAAVAEAHVLVNVSAAECFNMPLLEAMALGVPVVCGNDDFQAEVVGGAALTLDVHSGNVPAALAVALYGVLVNPATAALLRKNGLARAAGFSWASSAAVVQQGLAKALGLR